MLPAPTCSFTIPSIYDDTVLDCRIYTPSTIFTASAGSSRPWRKKAAIVAHPYAPLGGSFDDPVVDLVASAILKQGFIVGTFNFRGAGASKGRTSWTAKAEIKDYTSFIGFMIYFMHHLSPENLFHNDGAERDDDSSYDLSPVPSQALPVQHAPHHVHDRTISTPSPTMTPSTRLHLDHNVGLGGVSSEMDPRPILLLAGYSYGSLITTQLSSLQSILNLFHVAEVGTAASEIRLRAHTLAKEQTDNCVKLARTLQTESDPLFLSGHRRGRSLQGPQSPRKVGIPAAIRMGGEETNPDIRRASRESQRRSISYEAPERIRQSFDKVRALGRKHNGQIMSPKRNKSYNSTLSRSDSIRSSLDASYPENGADASAELNKTPLLEFGDIKAAYLLISPLQGLVHDLAMMWTTAHLLKPRPKSQPVTLSTMGEEEAKLVLNESFAIYGDEDIFTSSKKLRGWADRMQSVQGSRFNTLEIAKAGHFWHEHGAAARMREEVLNFTGRL